MLTSPQQVDLNDVNSLAEEFSLLVDERVTIVLTESLVRGTQHFDHGYQPIAVRSGANLQKLLSNVIARYDDNWLSSDGNAAISRKLSSGIRRRFAAKHIDIWLEFLSGIVNDYARCDCREVTRRQDFV